MRVVNYKMIISQMTLRQMKNRRIPKKNLELRGLLISMQNSKFQPTLKPNHGQCPTKRQASNGNGNIKEHHDV